MLSRLTCQLLAAVLALLTLAVLALAGRGLLDGEPLLRTVARLLFAAALGHGAMASWRAPARRGPQKRRRLLSVLGVLADPELQREYAESSPALPTAMALLEDWRRAVSCLDDPEAAAAFDEVERRELLALRSDLETLSQRLPDLEPFDQDLPAEVAFLRDDPAWRSLIERARRTAARFDSRAS